MKKLLSVIFCLAIFLEIIAQITVRTDRPTSRYETGENISFLVTSATAGSANYTIRYDEVSTPIQTGTVALQPGLEIPINFNLNENNHVVCEVNLAGEIGKAGAAIDCFNIQPVEEKPADFKAFWDGLINTSNGIPLDPVITPFSSTQYSTSYKMSLANIEGKRVYGYISVPVGDGPFPAIITFPPFGTDPSIVVPENVFSEWSNCISISLSIHNVDAEEVDPNAYLGEVITDRDQIYFKSGIMGAIRAIDYLQTRTDFDQTNICSYGVSQGGGLAMLFAGIDERVDVLMTTNPSLCEHAGLHYDRASGFPFYVNKSRGEDGSEAHELQTIAATKYYDAVHAASFFDGPTLMSISYLDGIAPGGASFTAFNQLQKDFKIMIHAPRLAHTNANEFWLDKFKMLNNIWPDATTNQPFPWAEANTGHFIDAGVDKDIDGMNSSLSGVVVKDGVTVNNWPVKWEKISGPGHVAFSSQNNFSTDVTFGDNGTYVLKFSADDNVTYAAEEIYYTLEDYITIEVSGIASSIETPEIIKPEIIIYPNPVQSEMTIELLNNSERTDSVFKIYNQQGQLVQKKSFSNDQNNGAMSFKSSTYDNGLYFLTVEIAGILHTKSFIIAN